MSATKFSIPELDQAAVVGSDGFSQKWLNLSVKQVLTCEIDAFRDKER
jgi:hypothetical protein